MKTILKNYSFSVSTKQITLTDVSTVRLDRLALITDVTTGKILYNFADSTVSTAIVSTNVVTLSVLQGGEANTDKLRIDYDADTTDTAFGNSTNATQITSSVLPTGASTSANQTTQNSTLSTIATNTGTKQDTFVTGTITTADAVVAAPSGNGLPLSGASTAGSIVSIASPGGASSWVASITGTISGTYYFEISVNSTNGTDGTWINVNGRQTGLVSTTTVADYKTTVTGEFRGSPAGAKYFRVRNVGGSGLSTTVTIGMGTGTGPVFLYSSIPNGTNVIGKVTTDQTTHGTTDLVAADNTKIAGTATDVNSGLKSAGTQRVVIATDDVNLSAINTNTTGLATSAGQTTMNTNLSSIATNTSNSATSANQTNKTQMARLTDGTNEASILKSDGTAAGQNSQLVASGYLSVAYTTTTVQAVALTDIGNYRWVSVQITGQGTSSTVTFQVSNDNVNWYSAALEPSTGLVNAPVTATTTAGLYHGPLSGRYFRLNVSGIASGTTLGQVVFFTTPGAMQSMGALAQLSTGVASIGTVGLNNPAVVTTGDTGAKTATFNGATITNGNAAGATIVLNIGTVTGTTPTLVAKLQGSADSGTTFYDIPNATTASLTATGVYGMTIYPGITTVAGTTTSGTIAQVATVLPRTWRVVYTIGGTTPSFTLTNVQVVYSY